MHAENLRNIVRILYFSEQCLIIFTFLFVSLVPGRRNSMLTATVVFLFLMAVLLVLFGLIIWWVDWTHSM